MEKIVQTDSEIASTIVDLLRAVEPLTNYQLERVLFYVQRRLGSFWVRYVSEQVGGRLLVVYLNNPRSELKL
jgi:hypothetical protein